jgi:uncharacterized membrane protein YvlD (DUF360 family)
LRFVYRWMANTVAFYVGLYFVDTLIAPFALIKKQWLAIVLAVILAAINSTIKPFPKFKVNRGRAFGFFGLTALGNYLFLQIISLLGAPMFPSTLRLMFLAIVLTLLGGLINHLVGFKPKDQSRVVTRERGLSDATKERLAGIETKSRDKRKRERR